MVQTAASLARIDPKVCLGFVRDWFPYAETYWYPIPDHPDLGCFGTGYNHNWGIQTNLKYAGAMAALGILGQALDCAPQEICELAIGRALAALRYDLRTHLSGDLVRLDGVRWGHGWITGLGLERAMYGARLLDPYLTDDDRAALRRVLVSEADWLLEEYEIVADPWGASGKNRPESNMWNGAILWRTAAMYPDHAHADAWRNKAHRFLVNAISIPSDAEDETILAGRPIKEWFVGANFFPHYSLDHHGYTNVGYSVVTLSNAAILHYDMIGQGLPLPETLYHHNADLWRALRRMIFSNGRLARIGGDSRVRYAYCQDFLLPVLVYATDHLGDEGAAVLLERQIDLIRAEFEYGGDGAFYRRRLAPLAEGNPYYHSRLESDRAAMLAMVSAYLVQIQNAGSAASHSTPAVTCEALERSLAGGWCEKEHGVVLHRSPSRLASFAWRAHGLTQGICQPPDGGHLCEWQQNLCSVVRLLGDDGLISGGQTTHRRLEHQRIFTYDGGFLTYGAVSEGLDLTVDEGWRGQQPILHQIAFGALPDGHTVIGLEHCRTLDVRCYLVELKGLHLNLPNDLYNRFLREVATAQGIMTIESPPTQEEIVSLAGPWANVDGCLGVVGLYGASELSLHRVPWRRGKYGSLFVEEMCWPCEITRGAHPVDPHSTILDIGWAVLSSADAQETARFAQAASVGPTVDAGQMRWVLVEGRDGHTYLMIANFGETEAQCPAELLEQIRQGKELPATEEPQGAQGQVALRPGEARLFSVA